MLGKSYIVTGSIRPTVVGTLACHSHGRFACMSAYRLPMI
jgi:hypothetical protein